MAQQLNYRIEIREPDGKVVYIGTSDLTPLGFAELCKKINEIDLGHGKIVTPQFRDWAWPKWVSILGWGDHEWIRLGEHTN